MKFDFIKDYNFFEFQEPLVLISKQVKYFVIEVFKNVLSFSGMITAIMNLHCGQNYRVISGGSRIFQTRGRAKMKIFYPKYKMDQPLSVHFKKLTAGNLVGNSKGPKTYHYGAPTLSQVSTISIEYTRTNDNIIMH